MYKVISRACSTIQVCYTSIQRLAIFITVLALAGCGGGSGAGKGSAPAEARGVFEVESIIPSASKATMLTSDKFIITFTKPVNPATVSPETMGIWSESQQRVLSSTLEHNGKQVIVTPTETLITGRLYTLVATDEVQSLYREPFEGLIASYTVDGFELVYSSTQTNSTNIHADSNLVMTFSDPVDLETVINNLVLHDTTDNVAIPYTIGSKHDSGYKPRQLQVYPTYRLPAGHTIEIRAAGGMTNKDGEYLQPVIRTFTVSDKWIAPREQDFYPGPDKALDPYDPIVITFTQDIDPSLITADDFFLRQGNKWVRTTTTVDGPRVIITPDEPLKYNTNYQVASVFGKNSEFKDMKGLRASGALNWYFDTRDAAEELALDFHPTNISTNKEVTQMYAYSDYEAKVAKVNLSDFTSVDYLQLDQTPQSVCVTGSNLYVLTLLNETSADITWMLREFDTQSLVEAKAASFQLNMEDLSSYRDEVLHCSEDRVLLQTRSSLYELYIDNSTGSNISTIEGFDSGITRVTDGLEGLLFYSTRAMYRLEDTVLIKIRDIESSYYWREGIIQASEDRNLLARGGGIYQLDTGELLSKAGKTQYNSSDEYVLAVDFGNMLWFSGHGIYSLEDFNLIAPINDVKGTNSFFDPYGGLYYFTREKLRRIDHAKISSGLLGN